MRDTMSSSGHRDKLDQLNELVTDHLLELMQGRFVDKDGNPIPLTNDDLRVIQQQLKNNSISAAAMPSSPTDRLRELLSGLQVSPGHLEARQKALPHLLPLATDAANCSPTAEPSEW